MNNTFFLGGGGYIPEVQCHFDLKTNLQFSKGKGDALPSQVHLT